MGFTKQATNLLTNKYFLYFMVFLSTTNVLGYLAMNKINAAVFFALIGLIMSKFSKNMSVILLVCVVSTNLLMANKMVREGLDGPDGKIAAAIATKTDDTATTTVPVTTDTTATTDTTVPATTATATTATATTVPPVTTATTKAKVGDLVKGLIADAKTDAATTDATTTDAATTTTSGFSNLEPKPIASDQGKKGSRIDLAGSLKSQFAELQSILGPDGVKGLTNETKELMTNQSALMGQMQQMGPMLSQAQNMLKGFDMDSIGGLGDMLKKMTPNK